MDKTVADHYNKVSTSVTASYGEREKSPILQLRKFNNFCKNLLISKYVKKIREIRGSINALDLCCGRGGDLYKWNRAGIQKLFGVDISDESIFECENRFESMSSSIDAQFIVADCTNENIWDNITLKNTVDITSCQFALHYAFESHKKAEIMLRNACCRLSDGGYFIGIIPNSFEILRYFLPDGKGEVSNRIMNIKMDSFDNRLFGSVYHFKLDELVDCPEFLIYFPLLKHMLKKYKMKCIQYQPLSYFFLINYAEAKNMPEKIQPLKSFDYSEMKTIYYESHCNGLSYLHMKDKLDKGKLTITANPFSLSIEEWTVVNLYSVFVFQKQNIPNPHIDDALHRTKKQDFNFHTKN